MRFINRARLIADRKASLEISVGAIIVIIFAVVILGFSLVMVRNLLAKSNQDVGQVINSNTLERPATADDPVTIDPKIIIAKGKSATVEIGLFNTYTDSIMTIPGTSVNPPDPELTSCYRAETPGVNLRSSFTLATPAQNVPTRSSVGFLSIVSVTNSAVPGIYFCTLRFNNNGLFQKDFIIQVT